MLNVSQKFHDNISRFPRTISATVEFDMVDVSAQGNCTPTANSIAGIGGVVQAADGLTQTKKYMSEEQNYLQLDGSFFTPPKPSDNMLTDSIGWWSAAISDVNGNFPAPYPTLTLTLSSPFTSQGLTFLFSPLTGDYCNSIQVVTTDNNNVQTTYTISPTSASYFWSQQLTNITSVVITFYSTNNPYRRVHMAEVLFGEQFLWTGQNLFDLNILEELDPLGNSAPPGEAHASIANSLNNFNIYLGNLQKKQPFKPYLTLLYSDGTSETVPMGTFFLYNWRNDNNYLSSTLFARDLLDVMSGTTFYKYTYSGTAMTLYDLAVAVIQDFEAQTKMTIAYTIDTALKNISTSGVLPAMTHHDVLMLIAQAGMGVVYVDRYNTLHIRQTVSGQPLNAMPYTEELTLSMQETYPKIAIQDPYNYFTINIYSNSISASSSTVYSGIATINGQIGFWVKYTTPASALTCSASVTGGTLISAQYYTDAAYLVINGTGSVTITITGKTITSTTSQSVLNNAGTQPMNGVNLDNPLVTDGTMVTNILNWYAAECLNTFLYEVESWMDPSVECGDAIYWDSQYTQDNLDIPTLITDAWMEQNTLLGQYYVALKKKAKIIRQEFKFVGTLSGTLNGKGG